jgi:hypothetical protein
VPVSWEIRDSILIVTLYGVAGEEPDCAVLAAIADGRFRPGTPLLLDFRQLTENPTAAEVRRRASRLARFQQQGLSGRCAMVVGPKVHHYGLARMAAIHMELEGMQVQIFQDTNAAKLWLLAAGKTEAAGK